MKQLLSFRIRIIATSALIGILFLQVAGLYNNYRLQNDLRMEHFQLSLHSLSHKICADSTIAYPDLLEQESYQAFQDHFKDGVGNEDFHLLILSKDGRQLYNNHPQRQIEIDKFPHKEIVYSHLRKEYITAYLEVLDNTSNVGLRFTLWLVLSALLLSVMGYSLIYIIKSSMQQMKLSKLKNDFINNMSHELKTPVATMSVASEMLVKKEILTDPDRSSRYAGIIRDESQRLRHLVDRVLNIAIFEKQQPKFKREEVNLHEILCNILQSFKVLIEKNNGILEQKLDASSYILTGDKSHITQAISNLIDNAIKYSPDTLFLSVRSYNQNDSYVLDVEDHGIGISKKQKERIFDKFHRVSTGNVHDIKGFGIGLYYVKNVVEQHKGTIEVISSVNKGSLFRVTLPLDI